jgi:hypothetical protein
MLSQQEGIRTGGGDAERSRPLTEMGGFAMKLFVPLVFVLVLTLGPALASAESPEDLFSTEGAITQVDAAENIIHVKVEGGLEVTFHLDDTTAVQAGEAVKSFADLQVGDTVKIGYRYNDNYEKVARSVIISSGKTEVLAT